MTFTINEILERLEKIHRITEDINIRNEIHKTNTQDVGELLEEYRELLLGVKVKL